MYNEEIQVMTLVRKAGLDKGGILTEVPSAKKYFTTDYFDMLIVEEQELNVPFSQWIVNDFGRNSDETSVQRYSLYFSKDLYEKYEKGKEALKRGSPFSGNNNYKFLSVIQVYISPEVLRRIKDSEKTVWSDIMLDIFIDDLYDAIEKFNRTYSEQNFIYRIYYALSAGDFAIVIKSQQPELSFYISSYIRKRFARSVVVGKKETKLAVYKTYTLLASEANLNGWDQNLKRLNGDGKFVLRASYSWKYWAEQQGVRNIDRIDRLNGRYDISTELTEQEFKELYPQIIQKDQNNANVNKSTENHLSWLIKNNYLSYINERYLMTEMEIIIDDSNAESSIELENIDDKELYELNKDYIKNLKNKQSHIENACESIFKEHKILKQYFHLLKRQIDFCRLLNEQSDTRVYAKGIETLLDTVFESINQYNEQYNIENHKYLSEQEFNQRGNLIIQYTKKAIYSINLYMEYVRNNNLQSLQTPNYNIESDMGMEKILIGYGEYLREYLRKYLEFYEKNQKVASTKKTTRKDFLPIVVPDLNSIDINVEALFPDSKAIELENSVQMDKTKTLLVINTPSVVELEDFPMAMAMLSHEIAHQFRYKERNHRNQVLIKLFSSECADMIADKLMDNFQMEQDEVISFPAIKTLLKNDLAIVIQRLLTDKKYGYAVNTDAPLDYLQAEMGENLLSFFRDFIFKSKVNKYFELFVQQTGEQSDIVLNKVEAIQDLYSIVNNSKYEEEKIEDVLKKYVEELRGMNENAIDKYILYMDDLMSQLNSEKEYKNRDTVDQGIGLLHYKLVRDWKKRNSIYKDKIQKNISISDYRMWALSGRYFGLDVDKIEGEQIFEDNQSKFFNRLKQIKIKEDDICVAKNKIELYREITSDIFMCCVMNLCPFAYLNIIVTNMWWKDLISNSYTTERIITIIFVISVKCNREIEQAIKIYNNVCINLLEILKGEINKILPDKCSEFEELIKQISDALNGNSIYIEDLENFRKELLNLCTYQNDIYIKIDKLLMLCNILIRKGYSYIEQLYENDFLKNDYFKAYEIHSKFRLEM